MRHLFLSATRVYIRRPLPSHLYLRMASTKSFGLKDSTLIKTQSFINGKWVDANDGKIFKVMNPATGEEIGTAPDMGRAETVKAVEVAAKAFKTWSRTTAKQRHDILSKFHGLIIDNADDLGRIVTLENGKILAEGKGEILYAATFIEWFAEEAVRTYGETIPSPYQNSRNVVIKQPVGVVAAMTPWNFPSAMITRKLGPALAAGCTMVLKPAPETPYSALALAELAQRAGIPDGVFNVVTTLEHVKEVGTELCESKTVKKVTFTGSTAVAKLLYKQSADTMKRFDSPNARKDESEYPLYGISIEAGGNAPFIVFDDANIEEAVTGAITSKYRSSGQTCVCANRIYVQSSIYAEFAARLAEKVAAFKVGNGFVEGTTHGPLIHSRAVEKVERHVQDAVQRGASVLVGGKRVEGPGSFFAPTVLSEVPPSALLTTEETFGPLAALIKFETEEEALRLANDTDVGLAGYFYSRDIGRIWRVAEALEVGMVGANAGMVSSVYYPFGGVKESGLGREGWRGIEEYLNIKLIAMGGV